MFGFNITGSGGEKKGQGGQRRRTRSPRAGGDQRHAVDAGDVVAEQGVVAAVGEHGGVAEHGGGEVGRRARLHQQQLALAHTLRAAEARGEQQSCGEEPHDPCGGGEGRGGGSEPAERGTGSRDQGGRAAPQPARVRSHTEACAQRGATLYRREGDRGGAGGGEETMFWRVQGPRKKVLFRCPRPRLSSRSAARALPPVHIRRGRGAERPQGGRGGRGEHVSPHAAVASVAGAQRLRQARLRVHPSSTPSDSVRRECRAGRDVQKGEGGRGGRRGGK